MFFFVLYSVCNELHALRLSSPHQRHRTESQHRQHCRFTPSRVCGSMLEYATLLSETITRGTSNYNRVDGNHLEPGGRLCESQPRMHPLLRRTDGIPISEDGRGRSGCWPQPRQKGHLPECCRPPQTVERRSLPRRRCCSGAIALALAKNDFCKLYGRPLP